MATNKAKDRDRKRAALAAEAKKLAKAMKVAKAKKPSTLSETQVEERICEIAREHGGTAYKFSSPGRRAVPDRLIVIPCSDPDYRSIFIEAKRPGETATGPQKREHKKLRDRGATVFVADTYESAKFAFDTVCDGSCKL